MPAATHDRELPAGGSLRPGFSFGPKGAGGLGGSLAYSAASDRKTSEGVRPRARHWQRNASLTG